MRARRRRSQNLVRRAGGRAGDAGRRQGAARDAGRREATAQHVAGSLDLDEPALDILGAQAAARRERRGGDGARDLAVAAQQAGAGVVAVGDGSGRAERERDRRLDARGGEEQFDQVEILGGEPVAGRRARQTARGLDDGGAALAGEVIEPGLPAGHVPVGERDEREQGVVDLLGGRGGRARPPRARGRWPRGRARRGRGRRWAARDAA